MGRRVIVAIQVRQDQDDSWRVGPPFAIAETVFDEYDFAGCTPAR